MHSIYLLTKALENMCVCVCVCVCVLHASSIIPTFCNKMQDDIMICALILPIFVSGIKVFVLSCRTEGTGT